MWRDDCFALRPLLDGVPEEWRDIGGRAEDWARLLGFNYFFNIHNRRGNPAFAPYPAPYNPYPAPRFELRGSSVRLLSHNHNRKANIAFAANPPQRPPAPANPDPAPAPANPFGTRGLGNTILYMMGCFSPLDRGKLLFINKLWRNDCFAHYKPTWWDDQWPQPDGYGWIFLPTSASNRAFW